MDSSPFWKLVYQVYPPLLRFLERMKVHSKRQPFILGKVRGNASIEEIQSFLVGNGFEHAILAWKDPEEVLSVRKRDKSNFQYHLRIYNDMEIRGHYEFRPETNPWKHIRETLFESKEQDFKLLLQPYLR